MSRLGQIFGFHLVGNLGKADKIGKANCELLALADDLDILLPGENQLIDLWGQVFCELR